MTSPTSRETANNELDRLRSELIDANLKIAFPNGVGTDRNPPRDKSRGCYTCPNCTMENGSVVTCSEHTENAE